MRARREQEADASECRSGRELGWPLGGFTLREAGSLRTDLQ